MRSKNTLEATNSRITEAEDRISELEDRMVEINESERKKKKELKEMRTISETSRKILNSKNISRTFSGVVGSVVGSVHFRIVPWSSLYFSRSIGPFLCSRY